MKGTWNIAYLLTLKLDFYFFPGFVCLSLFSLPPFCPTETIYSSHVSLLMTTATKQFNSGHNPGQALNLNTLFLRSTLRKDSYSLTFLFCFWMIVINLKYRFQNHTKNWYYPILTFFNVLHFHSSYCCHCQINWLSPFLSSLLYF